MYPHRNITDVEACLRQCEIILREVFGSLLVLQRARLVRHTRDLGSGGGLRLVLKPIINLLRILHVAINLQHTLNLLDTEGFQELGGQ